MSASPSAVTVIESDWFNAVYFDGVLKEDAKPEYLDAETAVRTYRGLGVPVDRYWLPDDVYDELLNGAGYPRDLAGVPLGRCQLIDLVT